MIQHNNQVFFEGKSSLIGGLADNFLYNKLSHFNASHQMAAYCPTAIVASSPLDLVAAAAYMAKTWMDGLVLSSNRLTEETTHLIRGKGYQILRLPDEYFYPEAAELRQTGRIGILTSGTTGTPKLIEHSWKTIRTVKAAEPRTWLLTYSPGTYAWWQMITLTLFSPEQSLVLPDRLEFPMSVLHAGKQYMADAISSTPTFWRVALMQFEESFLRDLPLKQITLGGEKVDQSILNRLRSLYPEARITHIYASTEAGACIVVHDGKEGFPAEWLDGERLKIHENTSQGTPVLWVKSQHRAIGQPEWVDTGDEVRVWGDRAVIIGRAGQAVINIGGEKISCLSVEKAVQEHPKVRWCRAYGKRAPIMGELVAVDVVGGVDEEELSSFCTCRLPAYAVPRIWNFMDHIPTGENFKGELHWQGS